MESCKRYTALTNEQFNDLYNSLPSIRQSIKSRRTAAAALFVYLMKMRTGFPNKDIAIQFGISETTVQRLIQQVRPILSKDMVPHYVNYVRNRQELIEHNTEMSNRLFDAENEGKVMLVCDATYIFIDKSRNYLHQKKHSVGRRNAISSK